MKTLSVLLACLTIFTFSVCVAAQEGQEYEEGFQFGIKGGFYKWIDGPLASTLDTNWIIGGEIKYWISEYIGFGGDIEWIAKDVEPISVENSRTRVDTSLGIDITQIPVNLDIFIRRVTDGGNSSLYVGFGPSFVSADITSTFPPVMGRPGTPPTIFTNSLSDSSFGFNTVVGLQIGHFFVEGQLILANATFPSFNPELVGPIEVEAQYGGFDLLAGFRF